MTDAQNSKPNCFIINDPPRQTGRTYTMIQSLPQNVPITLVVHTLSMRRHIMNMAETIHDREFARKLHFVIINNSTDLNEIRARNALVRVDHAVYEAYPRITDELDTIVRHSEHRIV